MNTRSKLIALVVFVVAILYATATIHEFEPYSVVCSDDGFFAPVHGSGTPSLVLTYKSFDEAKEVADRWRTNSHSVSYPKHKWRKCE